MFRQLQEDKSNKFNEVCKVVFPEHRQMFMTRYKYFCHFVELSFAVVSKTLNRESHIIKFLKLLWYTPIFLLSKTRRQAQFKDFIMSGDLELIMKIAKFSGNGMSRFMFYMINPSIKFHKKIYIPKNYERLTIKNLNWTLQNFLIEGTEQEGVEAKLRKKLRGAQSFNYKVQHKLEFVDHAYKTKGGKDLL